MTWSATNCNEYLVHLNDISSENNMIPECTRKFNGNLFYLAAFRRRRNFSQLYRDTEAAIIYHNCPIYAERSRNHLML